MAASLAPLAGAARPAPPAPTTAVSARATPRAGAGHACCGRAAAALVLAAAGPSRTARRGRRARWGRCRPGPDVAGRAAGAAAPEPQEAAEPEEGARLFERLPLELWAEEAALHPGLAADTEERFFGLPQQAESVIADAVERIERCAKVCVAPSATVHAFGSTVNGFGEKTSDLDVLVAVDEQELTYYLSFVHWHQKGRRYAEAQRRSDGVAARAPRALEPHLAAVSPKGAMSCAVQQLTDFLPEHGFEVVRSLPNARRPLVTLADRDGQLDEIDVSINNRLPLCNSRLLRSYSMLDDRVRPLVLLVKNWAKRMQVCGANEGNLSSYAWTIMVVYFLQLAGILPSLQVLADSSSTVQDINYWGQPCEFDTSFLGAEEYLARRAAEGGAANDGFTMAHLVFGFFHFFCRAYRWGRGDLQSEVVSIRCADRRRADPWFLLYGKAHPEPGLHVEDPIELRDLNIVLRRERLAQLKAELARADSLLAGGGSLEELLSARPLEPVTIFARPGRRRVQRAG